MYSLHREQGSCRWTTMKSSFMPPMTSPRRPMTCSSTLPPPYRLPCMIDAYQSVSCTHTYMGTHTQTRTRTRTHTHTQERCMHAGFPVALTPQDATHKHLQASMNRKGTARLAVTQICSQKDSAILHTLHRIDVHMSEAASSVSCMNWCSTRLDLYHVS